MKAGFSPLSSLPVKDLVTGGLLQMLCLIKDCWLQHSSIHLVLTHHTALKRERFSWSDPMCGGLLGAVITFGINLIVREDIRFGVVFIFPYFYQFFKGDVDYL
jgi:hypothetical protein